MPKAYSYIRFSSAEQKRGDSYRRQLQRSEEYAAQHGLELVKDSEYSFLDEGRSGFTGQHVKQGGDLGRFLKRVEDGSIPAGSYLLIESFDRLSREALNVAVPRFMDILNSGVVVVTLMDDRLYTKDFNQIDLIYSIMMMGTAHEESAKKSDRVGRAWRNKQQEAIDNKKPMSSIAPAWLKLVDGAYEPIPERVAVVEEIYSLCINGYGSASICRILNERNIPIFGTPARNKRNLWGNSSVKKILTARTVLGEYQPFEQIKGTAKRQPLGAPVKDFYPAIISEEVFYQALSAINQRRVSKSTKQSTDFNVFSKIGFCAKCGAPMHKINKGESPKGGKYLVCSDAKRGGCEYHAVRLEHAESLIKEVLVKVDSLSLVQSNEAKLRKDLAVVQAKIIEQKKMVDELDELLEVVRSVTIGRKMEKAESVLADLKVEEQALQQQMATDKISSKREFFEKLDLISYEGRNRANSLLIRLGVRIEFESAGIGKTKNQLMKIKNSFTDTYGIGSREMFYFAFAFATNKATLKLGEEVGAVFFITHDGEVFPYAKSLPTSIASLAQDDHPLFALDDFQDVSPEEIMEFFKNDSAQIDEAIDMLNIASNSRVAREEKNRQRKGRGEQLVTETMEDGYYRASWKKPQTH